jgi:hypothetical protein
MGTVHRAGILCTVREMYSCNSKGMPSRTLRSPLRVIAMVFNMPFLRLSYHRR